MANINIALKNKNVNVTAFGLKFDNYGVCNADKEVVQSLLDAKHVFEVKDVKKHQADIKKAAGVEDED